MPIDRAFNERKNPENEVATIQALTPGEDVF
jgi:hypothetical protein